MLKQINGVWTSVPDDSTNNIALVSTPQPDQQVNNSPSEPFNLGKTLGDWINSIKQAATDPKTYESAVKSALVGTIETGANIRKLIGLGDQQDEDVLKKLSAYKQSEFQDLTPTQKGVTDIAAYATPTLASLSTGALGVGKGLLTKMLAGGADFAAQSQLLFNPNDHPLGEETKARLNDGIHSFIAGAAFPIGEAVGSKAIDLTIKPMVNAVKSLADGVVQKLTDRTVEQIFQNVSNPVDIALSRDFLKVSSKDFTDYLKGGEATPEVKQFFSSPEWTDIAKKYGADVKNYPEFIYGSKPIETATEPITQQGVSGLLPSPSVGNFEDEMSALVTKAADSRAKLDTEGQNSALQEMKAKLDEFQQGGYTYKSDPEKIVNLVTDFSNHIRAVDDSFREIAVKETKQSLVDNLQSTGLLPSLTALKRDASLLGNKIDDSEKILTSYNKDAKKNGFSSWDALSEALRENGIEITDPADLINFAKSIPTKSELNKKVDAPPAFDLNSRIQEAFKLEQPKQVEQPYAVAKSKLEELKSQIAPEAEPVLSTVKDIIGTNEKATADAPLVDEGAIGKDSMFTPSLKDRLLSGMNPLAFESSRLMTYGGEAGKEMVDRGKRAYYTTMETRAAFKNFNQSSGLQLLSEEELTNLRRVIENKASPLNEQVATVAGQVREQLNEWGQKILGQDRMIDNYFPRVLNDLGREALANASPNNPIIMELAKANDMDVGQFLRVTRKLPKKEFYEYSRILPEIPEKYLADPLTTLAEWQDATARKWGVISQFGQNGVVAEDLINKMVMQAADPATGQYAAKLGDEYRTRIFGKFSNYTDVPALSNWIKQAFVTAKLSPLTTVSNELQGFVNSYLDYGIRGVIDANRATSDNWVKKMGLDNMSNKFDEFKSGQFADKYLTFIGMNASEARGYNRTASSSFYAIQRAWDTLVKDNKNQGALKFFADHGMFVDPQVLLKSLASKELPKEEVAMGVMEGIRRKMFFNTPGERPTWATTAMGSPVYVFKNYLLSQLRLLKDAPLGRQIAYLGVIAPVTGLPIMLLRRAITGREMPQTPYDWYVSSTTAGSATYLDLYEAVNTEHGAIQFATGSYSPVANLLFATSDPVYNKDNPAKGIKKGDLTRGLKKAAFDTLPLPGGSLVSSVLFPSTDQPSTEDKTGTNRFKARTPGDATFKPASARFKPRTP